MGMTLNTGPTSEPVTLAEAKAHTRVAIADDDGLLAGYVLAARNHLEEITGRAFLTQTWDYKIDYDWPWFLDTETHRHSRLIEITKAPLQSVTSITYVDSAGASQTLASNQYVVDGSSVIGRIYPAYGVSWPTVRSQRDAITVRFVTGWTDNFPDSLRQAILLLVGHWYENRETVVIGQAPSELPMAVASLIAPFRVFY
jgi:uncharacterized phiE125 gp8 family phage protein